MAFDLGDYKDVATRRKEFRELHPSGSLRCKDWRLVEINGQTFVAYTAQAYRSPDDDCPGEGTAWEQVPGATPYTRGSELQNAETSAWGRAINATLALDEKNLASREEVRNRRAEPDAKERQKASAPVCKLCEKPITGRVEKLDFGGYAHPDCYADYTRQA